MPNEPTARERVKAAIEHIRLLKANCDEMADNPACDRQSQDAMWESYRVAAAQFGTTLWETVERLLLSPRPTLSDEGALKLARPIATAHCANVYAEDCARDISAALQDAHAEGRELARAEIDRLHATLAGIVAAHAAVKRGIPAIITGDAQYWQTCREQDDRIRARDAAIDEAAALLSATQPETPAEGKERK